MTGQEAEQVGRFLKGLDELTLATGVEIASSGFLDVVTNDRGRVMVGELRYSSDDICAGIYSVVPMSS